MCEAKRWFFFFFFLLWIIIDHETRRDEMGVGCLVRGTRKKRSTREEKKKEEKDGVGLGIILSWGK